MVLFQDFEADFLSRGFHNEIASRFFFIIFHLFGVIFNMNVRFSLFLTGMMIFMNKLMHCPGLVLTNVRFWVRLGDLPCGGCDTVQRPK